MKAKVWIAVSLIPRTLTFAQSTSEGPEFDFVQESTLYRYGNVIKVHHRKSSDRPAILQYTKRTSIFIFFRINSRILPDFVTESHNDKNLRQMVVPKHFFEHVACVNQKLIHCHYYNWIAIKKGLAKQREGPGRTCWSVCMYANNDNKWSKD